MAIAWVYFKKLTFPIEIIMQCVDVVNKYGLWRLGFIINGVFKVFWWICCEEPTNLGFLWEFDKTVDPMDKLCLFFRLTAAL